MTRFPVYSEVNVLLLLRLLGDFREQRIFPTKNAFDHIRRRYIKDEERWWALVSQEGKYIGLTLLDVLDFQGGRLAPSDIQLAAEYQEWLEQRR